MPGQAVANGKAPEEEGGEAAAENRETALYSSLPGVPGCDRSNREL